ncbi:MAG: hypothetical protein ACP5H2_04310 [Solirubrobacteraceae bacterium]
MHNRIQRSEIALVDAAHELNRTGVRRYLDRVSGRWRLDGAYIAGPEPRGETADSASDLGPDLSGVAALFDESQLHFRVVLVSNDFDELPWLERTHTASSLWDVLEMGATVEVECYTRAEFERKRQSNSRLRDTIWHGLDLLALI